MKQRISEALGQFDPLFDESKLVGFSNGPSGETIAIVGPQWAELCCTGVDACDFINRMTTLTPHQMEDGAHSPGFILEHNGKIKVSFDLFRRNAQSVSLFCDPEELELLADTLSMFHFAEHVEFEQKGPLQVLVLTGSSTSNLQFADDTVQLSPWRGIAGMDLRVCQVDDFILQINAIFARQCSIGSHDEFERLRIGVGMGMPFREYTAQVTPLDVNGLSGIVQQKGCYPGQEVIERTLAIGRPAKKLVLIAGDELHSAGEIFNDSKQNVGIITSIVRFDETSMCGLAIVKGRLDVSQTFHTDLGNVSLREI